MTGHSVGCRPPCFDPLCLCVPCHPERTGNEFVSLLEDPDGAPYPEEIQRAFRTRVLTLVRDRARTIKRAETAESERDDCVRHFATVVRAYGHIEFDKATLAETDPKCLTFIVQRDPSKSRFEYRKR